jgi:DNA-binding GntR family transcriptional regulator
MSDKTKKDQIADLLREIILTGELRPGDRLLQTQLAERFDVSATPIREAIQQLVAEGVLSHSPYKGVQVAEVSLTEMREIYLIRAALEPLATRMAVPNLRISDINQLHNFQSSILASIEADDLETMLKRNYDFHWLIYDAAAMSHLSRILRNLWVKSLMVAFQVFPARSHEAIAEHQHILAAIDAGDADLAADCMRQHVESVERMLSRHLKQ